MIKNVKDIKDGSIVFMPSGFQATLYLKEDKVVVEYPQLYKDEYSHKDFQKILDEGVIEFYKPSQMVMEAYENAKREEGSIFKALDKDNTAKFVDPETKIELLNKLDKISKSNLDVYTRQQALSFMDALSLQDNQIKEIEQFVKTNINEEFGEFVDNPSIEYIATQIEDGNKEGFEPYEFGNWKLTTSLDTEWEKLTPTLRDEILYQIHFCVHDGHIAYTDMELLLSNAGPCTGDDLASLEIFSTEDIMEYNKGAEKSAYISFEIDYDGQIGEMEESFKLKKKDKKKLADNYSGGINNMKTNFKVYQEGINEELGTFGTWDEAGRYIDSKYTGEGNKDDFLSQFNIEIVDCPDECVTTETEQAGGNAQVGAALGHELVITKDPVTNGVDEEGKPNEFGNSPNATKTVLNPFAKLSEMLEMCMQGPTTPEKEMKKQEDEDKKNKKDVKEDFEPKRYIVQSKTGLEDWWDQDSYATLEEAITAYNSFDPNNYTELIDTKHEDEILMSKGSLINEEFSDTMGMVTNVEDMDFPNALKDTVEVKDDGSLYNISDVANELKELTANVTKQLDDMKADIKTSLQDIKQDIKQDINNVGNNINNELGDTQNAIDDLSGEEAADMEAVEFEDAGEEADLEPIELDDEAPAEGEEEPQEDIEEPAEEELEESLNEDLDYSTIQIGSVVANLDGWTGDVVDIEYDEHGNVQNYIVQIDPGDPTVLAPSQIKAIIQETKSEESQLIEKYCVSGYLQKLVKTDIAEDIGEIQQEVNKMINDGTSGDQMKKIIALKAENDDEKEAAEDYAAEQLKESLLRTKYTSTCGTILNS